MLVMSIYLPQTLEIHYLLKFLYLNDKQPYFHSFVEYFTQRGYNRNLDIRAAPYDWRLATGMKLIKTVANERLL